MNEWSWLEWGNAAHTVWVGVAGGSSFSAPVRYCWWECWWECVLAGWSCLERNCRSVLSCKNGWFLRCWHSFSNTLCRPLTSFLLQWRPRSCYSCSNHPLCVHIMRGCVHPHSHYPTPCSLSYTNTPWSTWPASQQPKNSEEARSSLFDSNSPLTERIHHPNCHKSSYKDLSSLKKNKQRTIRRTIENFSIEWLTYMLKTDVFNSRKCEVTRTHLRNGNASAFHVAEVYITFSFCLWCAVNDSKRIGNQTQCVT